MDIIETEYTNNIFENIKHVDEYKNEYWFARELSKVLEYKDWRNFQKVIDKAVLLQIIAFQAKKIGLLKSTSQ